MNSSITRRDVARQFIIAIEMLLEWIEQKENSNGESMGKDVGEDSIETRLLTAPDVARILNASSAAAYQLIQQKKMPIVCIYRKVNLSGIIVPIVSSDSATNNQAHSTALQ